VFGTSAEVRMPEDWDQQLAVLRESLVALPQLVKGVASDRLHRAPAPGEWSAHVVVCHLVLNEMNTAMSLRLILTQDRPSLAEIEDDRCAERFAPLYPDTETALGVWRALREDNLRLCASVSPEDRERLGQLPRSDKDVSFRRYVASRGRHDRNHIEQIRSALTG
jgi:DinB superfamily